MRKSILAVLMGGVWITVSEFLRNELLFKNLWIDHFNNLGLSFQTLPVNGVLWMIWSFILACLIYRLQAYIAFGQTLFLAWLAAFAMMWITLFNLKVLPLKLLFFAIPLSILEVVVAGLIIRQMTKE